MPRHSFFLKKPEKRGIIRGDPYQGYQKSKKLYFPIKNSDSSVHPKKWSLLLKYGTQAKILVLDRLPKKNQRHVVKFVKKSIDVAIDHKGKSFVCPKVRGLSCMTGFYFALKTFYPTAIVE
ncbi:MAG: DUF3179 domain-containing protein [Halobacteriovoraceae bacterium]|nr:DUF3179 domain-containing protein [Halobacteriovoraceae bacterium]MBT5094850.1 DUF3179 domain-containing protein [Halobacteriovoraceae bacterium]